MSEVTPYAPLPAGPMAMLASAMALGMTMEQAESALERQREFDAEQRRLAFVAARLELHKSAPVILRKRMGQAVDEDSVAIHEYSYASLGDVVQEVIEAATKHGFSHSWVPALTGDGKQEITCVVTHSAGHSESATLIGPCDTSGGKNELQGDQSARSYLQRNSLLLAYGLATIDQFDNDGAPLGTETGSQGGNSAAVLDSWLVYVNNAGSLDELDRVRHEAGDAFTAANDVTGWEAIKRAVNARRRALEGQHA
ncbi:ERF family protein [Paracidovorax avenae]|uniref:ERF family protein n=1 Tax=Paracidovorax avenae TaxID=80867 RepID=UPI0018655BD2|nr:ERF family protein [Paracidovorax avenae]